MTLTIQIDDLIKSKYIFSIYVSVNILKNKINKNKFVFILEY